MKRILVAVIFFVISGSAFAWTGTDQDGNSVTIDKGQTVRPGYDIEYYDDEAGEYRSGTVDSMRRYGSSVEVEITTDDGETKTLDMDD